MSDEHAKFVLVGHDCPLGEYPSIVVPVGKLEEHLVVLYSSPNGPQLVDVSSESAYVHHSSDTNRKLAEFDHKLHGLFAFGEQSLTTYVVGREGEFFVRLLRSSESADLDLFYRFSLAKESGEVDLIKQAFDECVRKLRSDSPEFAEQWIKANRVSSFGEIRPQSSNRSIPTRNRQNINMPTLFLQRGQPYLYAFLRQQEDFGFVEYDIVAPPRRFFSGIDPTPSAVEIGVDGRRLQAVASPAELLGGTLSEGDNLPAHSRRTVSKLWAWFLVCEDPQRRLESREVETLAHQASLVRHVLDSPNLNRVLIADEVGLGKTVEAGLIVSELLEKQPGLRVLYFAPARLVRMCTPSSHVSDCVLENGPRATTPTQICKTSGS